ncbi:enoyl-CoA hydratase/isomerase family protein [Dactylosporangium sp. AC04546]|uniref:enoyl-CoA hydratase/isomerase family protein n=1 Tax=Dactylosporangium sp. AC04546 TaxID=2862460 RepID=UPI001EDE0A2D|nr:enoyl-CoA hydratase/isomerase family protein [Dactylosporangium sp. AC04546]WVK89119.1 enoyl-CoA hydratase/isomerase family protein [Dactylosporangium sp. AC04546]
MHNTPLTSKNAAPATLQVSVDAGVAWVELNRPEVLNSFNETMLRELADLWARLRVDDEVRVVVVTGAGEKAFCTGYDRSGLDDADDADDGADDDADGSAAVLKASSPFLRADVGDFLGPKSCGLWKPVVAAVNGIACGGAFYLLGEADIIIAADHATFFDPHTTFGMPAVFEPLHLLRRMPLGEVLRLTLLGSAERMSAQRALDVGLVSEVVPGDQLRSAAGAVAATIAALPPLAVQASLRAIWIGSEMAPGQALGVAHALVAAGTDPAALAAGQQAFRTGGRPRWRLR